MPGQRLPSTKYISFCIDRDLWFRITQYAESIGKTRNGYVTELFEREMDRLNVSITDDNRERSKQETMDEIARRKGKAALSKYLK